MREAIFNNAYSSFDFYPFGMIMPGHSYTATSSYRFGFNKGSEKDNEIKGEGNSLTTYYREVDTRLGLWWGLDPKPKAFETPYSSMDNKPIMMSDPKGDCPPRTPCAAVSGSLSLSFGGGRAYVNAGATASIGQRLNFAQPTLDLSISAYNGGLGTSGNSNKFQFDVTAALHLTVGGGTGGSMPQYTLNYNTKSAMPNTFGGSATYGQMVNFNSATNAITRQGLVGGRGGNFSFSSNNDAKTFPYAGQGTDQGWTGGIILSVMRGKDLIEGGYQSFTGTHFGKDVQNRTLGGSFYYDQTAFQKSLNKANTFFRIDGIQSDSYGSGWLQNEIHTGLNNKFFHYDYYDNHTTGTIIKPQ